MKVRFFKTFAAVLILFLMAALAAGCGQTTEGGNSSSVSSQTAAVSGLNESAVASAAESTAESNAESTAENTSSAEERPIAGVWQSVSEEGTIRMALFEDGTVLFSASDLANRTFGSWSISGQKVTLTIYGGDDVYTLRDGRLISDDNPSLIFEKTEPIETQE